MRAHLQLAAQAVITVCALLALGVGEGLGQPDTAWVHTYDLDTEMYQIYDVKKLSDSGFVAVGVFSSLESSTDMTMMVIDPSGRIRLRRKWIEPSPPERMNQSTASGYAVEVSPIDGSIFIAGGWGDGQEGGGLIVHNSPDGDSLWMKTYGQPVTAFNACCMDEEGNLYLAGTSSHFADHGSQDAFLMKLNDEGEEIWHTSYGGARVESGLDMIRTSDGGFALTGKTSSFGNGTQFYLVKTDSLGEEEWSGVYRGAGNSVAFAVGELSDGGFVMAGKFWPSGLNTSTDMLIVRVNAEGDELWQQSFGDTSYGYTESFNDLVVLPSGDIVVLGQSSDADHSGVLMRLTSDGLLRWEQRYNLLHQAEYYSLCQIDDGSYIFAGSILVSGAFLAKTEPDSTDIINSVRLLDPAFPSFIALDAPYPNPFNSFTCIAYTLPTPSDVQLRVYDLMGWEVATLFQGRQMAGGHLAVWDGRNTLGAPVSSGMYFVCFETPGFTGVSKMTLTR